MPNGKRRIAVTGASGYVGRLLIKRLQSLDSVEHILATDIRNSQVSFHPKVVFANHDITQPMDRLLSEYQPDTVVHLAFMLKHSRDSNKAWNVNVGGAANVMEACRKANIRHLLNLSTTTIYGSHVDNPKELTEESPIRPTYGFQYSECKAAIEVLLQGFTKRNPDISVTNLRACPVMGPHADNFISQAFSKPLLVGVRGYDPKLQFLHEEDMADVMTRCVMEQVNATFNIGGHGGIRWSEMVCSLGRKMAYLPASLLYGMTGLAWTLRLQRDSPACGLDFIRYGWRASTAKIRRELGVEFNYSSKQAWDAFVRPNYQSMAGEVVKK